MTSDVLLFGKDADYYRDHLSPEFPALRFHVAKDAASLSEEAARSEALVSMAPAVTSGLVRGLPQLRWVQVTSPHEEVRPKS